ncbi:ComEC family competence protein [Jannaschia sp. S6380]|uniref:ComEC/Rec2 family competence protein n=1 Tax=Jannaschia sp. S6380 TaxID=2926408 RepID=UPI001FF6D5FB|nr:ComEC/Rec2 family competence protein [Jannaschia sp. S6380]MCK0166456.1 ComEC family competence protein [Jannaschia sp. S6380]
MHPVDAAPAPGLRASRVVAACQGIRGHRLPWFALALGTGVGLYFALPVEPDGATTAAIAAAAVALCVLAWLGRGGAGLLALLGAVLLGGMLVAQVRSVIVSGPVLEYRYYGAVEGRIVRIDRSASGAMRLTLDRVRLDRMAPGRTPHRVRISLQDETGVAPRPGLRVMTTGHLSPPAGPTEPGGFDFQRHAWFQGLGAIGYGRIPLMQAEAPSGGTALLVARVRTAIAEGLRDRLPGQSGQVAAAITTGDRGGLSKEVTEALRASNLAHLLAISGLHMGLLVGFVFWVVRGGLALIPTLALRYPTRAWAAAVALPFALAYLFLSGGSVATQRAFVMAAVMLGAILVGSRALSIRSVAIAAILVLLWRPESLTGPGFQMSFAATGALVLVFGAISRGGRGRWLRGWRGAFLSLLLSSLVAGAATAPFAALHFNRVGQFGVLANLLAVPAMGTVVMPALLLSLLLWPLGLEALPLAIAGRGIEWILQVADWIATMPGALRPIAAPSWYVLPLLGLAAGLLGAARGPTVRSLSVACLVAAAVLWARTPRPAMLISDDARLVGVMVREGRWLSRDSGAGFVADAWLENDGDLTTQEEAAARQPPGRGDLPFALIVARRKSELEDALHACRQDADAWLISATEIPRQDIPCRVFDPTRTARTGAIAVDILPDGGPVLRTARDLQGDRPWVPKLKEW